MPEDLHVLRDRARAAAAQGDTETALTALLAAASHTHLSEHDYASVLRPLEEILGKRGDVRGALTIAGYLASSDIGAWTRAKELARIGPSVDRARLLAFEGRMVEGAREMEAAGKMASAAILHEKARDWPAARALWSRLVLATQGGIERGDDAYVAALVRFNLARCARQCGEATQAREAIVSSVRLLEEAADLFESTGLRERAFDCFQVLVQIGRENGSFEDVLEGFVNCIRVLREDHLKHFALEYYGEAIATAAEHGEFGAAATLAREAGQYARSFDLTDVTGTYAVRQAELWRRAARQHSERGAPPEVAENALLAAVLAFSDVAQYARVGEVYAELGGLDLEPAKRAHYARAGARYVGVKDQPLGTSSTLERPLLQDTHVAPVWHLDVVEWEQRGSAAEVCADILLDKRWPDLIRRRAMLARLTALQVEGQDDDDSPHLVAPRVLLTQKLGQLQLYVALSPLEKLFARPERRVKIAVLQALQTLFFKRSFLTVRAALRDPDPTVAEQACHAIEALYFPHAVDPLARILRESSDPTHRASALRALAKIDTLEAAELLMGVLEHGPPEDSRAAAVALKRARGAKFVELARAALRAPLPADHALARALREVLGARGKEYEPV